MCTRFFVRVQTAGGVRGLYFEDDCCLETATELRAFRGRRWAEVRQQLQRRRLDFDVLTPPPVARSLYTRAPLALMPLCASPAPLLAQSSVNGEQVAFGWGGRS
jgi:hypothetical protein